MDVSENRETSPNLHLMNFPWTKTSIFENTLIKKQLLTSKDKKPFARVGHACRMGWMDGKNDNRQRGDHVELQPIHSWFGVNTFELTSEWNMFFLFKQNEHVTKKVLTLEFLLKHWLKILKLIKQILWFWSTMILLRHPLITHNLWNDSLSAPTPQYESKLWKTKGIDKKHFLICDKQFPDIWYIML